MKARLIPAILAKSKGNLAKQLSLLKGLSKEVQFDIIDGKFVNNKTIAPKSIPKSSFNVEVHLMVKTPSIYIDDVKGKVRTVIFHVEGCKDYREVLETISKIRINKMNVGIAINPETPLKKIIPFIKGIDKVLVMTVHPGFQHQSFLASALKKVRAIRAKNKKIDIGVDGGVGFDHVRESCKAGATSINSGSYLLREGKTIKTEVAERIRIIKRELS